MLQSSFHCLCHRSRNNLLQLALRHITLVILTVNLKYDGIDIVDHLLPGDLHDRMISNKASCVFAPMHNARQQYSKRHCWHHEVSILCSYAKLCSKHLWNKLFFDGFWREKQEYVVSQESYLKLEEK